MVYEVQWKDPGLETGYLGSNDKTWYNEKINK